MSCALVLYTRDLRVHDHPPLAAADRDADRLVPAFVFDEDLLASQFAAPNRLAFLLESLHDLRDALRDRDASLAVRRGDWVEEAVRLAEDANADTIHLSEDYSAYAKRRLERLRETAGERGIEVCAHPGITVVPPGEVTTGGGDHYRVFTPYSRAWSSAEWRDVERTPRSLSMHSGVTAGELPELADLTSGEPSPDRLPGGETAGRERLHRWLRQHGGEYDDRNDDLAGDVTSRLSPYFHFGCVSPREAIDIARGHDGTEAWIRQLCWRDFHHQTLDSFEALGRRDFRGHGDRWSRSEQNLEAWKRGETGFPIVDAGMRQLTREGFMHNRARMITASFLTKHLYIDWRWGAAHFFEYLLDGDIANNNANWQWTAGTGTDTRPNRIFNPLRQADRFDPDGEYVRRYVTELSGIEGSDVHRPWDLRDDVRDELDYPEPIVDLEDARQHFLAKRDA